VSAEHKPPLGGTTPSGVINWLAGGSRGQSSNTIVQHLTGLPACGRSGTSHPYDPDDLDRCLLLLSAVPLLRVCMPYMASCSPQWAALIERWEEIEASHLEEVGLGWSKAHSAPKTYALMRSILDPVRAQEAQGDRHGN
jgi:hypothetical protein